MPITVTLHCDTPNCEAELAVDWPAGEYASILDPSLFKEEYGGRITLDGSVKITSSGWTLDDTERHKVRCPSHSA